MMTKTTATLSSIESVDLSRVIGGGAADQAYCSALRAQGMTFGNGSAGGQVAQAAAPQLFPSGAPDGLKAALAQNTAAALAKYPSPVVKAKIEGGMPDFCK